VVRRKKLTFKYKRFISRGLDKNLIIVDKNIIIVDKNLIIVDKNLIINLIIIIF